MLEYQPGQIVGRNLPKKTECLKNHQGLKKEPSGIWGFWIQEEESNSIRTLTPQKEKIFTNYRNENGIFVTDLIML